MERPSPYEHAGGRPALLRLAAAHHQRCLDDPVLNHPFSHPRDPNHVGHLADPRNGTRRLPGDPEWGPPARGA